MSGLRGNPLSKNFCLVLSSNIDIAFSQTENLPDTLKVQAWQERP